MKVVWVIVKKDARGPSGHGELAEQYCALMQDWKTGAVAPAFESQRAGEVYMAENDRWGRHVVMPLPLVEECSDD